MEHSDDIVDMQVNLGQSAFGPDCDFETYRSAAEKLGITKAIVFPTPTHVSNVVDGTETSCLWRPEVDASQRYYLKREWADGSADILDNPSKPYQAYNREMLQFVRSNNEQKSGLQLYLAAKVHPYLDDPTCLEGLLGDELVSLKIHGIATHSHPDAFPIWLNEFLCYHDLPIVVHTDWYRGEEDTNASPYQKALIELCKLNSPPNYIRWAIRNRLKVCINHGARLHEESIHIVNNEPDLVLAYGPDSHLDARQDHLVIPTEDYAASLFTQARTDKVLFSTDYRWNIGTEGAWDDLRWDSIDRIRNLLDPADQQKVLADNAISFYGLR